MIFDELINDKNILRARAFKVADDKTVLFCHLVWFVCVDANKFLWLSGRVLRYQRKGCGFDSQGTHVPTKICITWMHCKSLWIKASDKCKLSFCLYNYCSWCEQASQPSSISPHVYWCSKVLGLWILFLLFFDKSQSLLQFSVSNDPSEIILICWFVLLVSYYYWC